MVDIENEQSTPHILYTTEIAKTKFIYLLTIVLVFSKALSSVQIYSFESVFIVCTD